MFQPTTFGKYFLTRRIAVGGMAEVFAAKLYGADGFEKDLVIKQILPQHARDPEFVQSFVAEAKIAVGLSHANIVAIYELGRVDGTYFIAMELVDGLDGFALLEAARRHELPVPVGAAARIVEDVAAGLDYAHRRSGPDGQPLGLVHRDLNPRNVLISQDGEVKILDFGIAKTAPGVTDMPKTRAGVVKGTTGYMSPEQAMGREIDARTDIYQAGLLLYELLTGEALFWRPDEEETRARMREHAVVAPSVHRPEVPRALDQVVLTALARNPVDRFQSAGALADALMHARAECPGKSDHASLGALVSELRRRDARAVERASSDEIPVTRDISEVISQAIEHTLTGRIETFARSAGLPEPSSGPTTGSTPLDLRTPRPTGPEPQVVLTQSGDLVAPGRRPGARAATPAPGSPPARATPSAAEAPRPGSTRGILLTALLLALLAALGFAVRAARQADDPAPAAGPLDPYTPPARVAARPAPPAATTPTTASATASPTLAAVRPERPRRPAPAPRYGVVDFGTRSCSSRVTVDGRIVTRTTPSFGHQLSAGDHTVLIEGTSCPPIERPGSLRRVQPTVSGRFTLPAGGAMKVIADFDDGRLMVRTVAVR